ncbi:CpsD/CapB family tyrosine-protein kinase [Paenibacillus provencensis]|uniref:non-specific protein-tyrosine kinase n=1 Tax=Paenibacillus provencensis TaxID=441151 RepID=A0ABW3PS98_9BACL|nr:CpsD/CapB family tyrosine-protein kinase [Paenibacillus sp. MER 78]MCM3127721.1 CpsD/CapB family tyrosine-protein kinase [Paenibacillus sp. MER 78]
MPRSTSSQHYLVTATNPKASISEAYRTLRTNIQFSAIDEQIKVLMVASAQSGEGKTTTVSNLAVTYAQEGKKVLVIDTDLRKPSLHQVFKVSNHAGLSSALAGQYLVNEVLQKSSVFNLDILPAGPVPPNPSEMLGSRKMQALLEELSENYEMIFFDTPPVLAVTDAMIVSSFCDGVILVVNSGKVKKDLVKKAKARLEHVNSKILGVVLNNLQVDKQDASHNDYYGLR